MSKNGPQLGDAVEVQFEDKEPTITTIDSTSFDARGDLRVFKTEHYTLGATAEEFSPKTDTPESVVDSTQKQAKWTIAYGEAEHM
ncbi:hypothetical protein KJ632_03000 [Patescibacteria group bacterium]|nr:hypothetical protein [Patescibacteria group bacterium]